MESSTCYIIWDNPIKLSYWTFSYIQTRVCGLAGIFFEVINQNRVSLHPQEIIVVDDGSNPPLEELFQKDEKRLDQEQLMTAVSLRHRAIGSWRRGKWVWNELCFLLAGYSKGEQLTKCCCFLLAILDSEDRMEYWRNGELTWWAEATRQSLDFNSWSKFLHNWVQYLSNQGARPR